MASSKSWQVGSYTSVENNIFWTRDTSSCTQVSLLGVITLGATDSSSTRPQHLRTLLVPCQKQETWRLCGMSRFLQSMVVDSTKFREH